MASVGIFWFVSAEGGRSQILFDATPLVRAVPYGDCLTHDEGHAEFWERTRRGALGEYDEWPRGRVVFEMRTERFVIYADRQLHRRAFIQAVRIAFGLKGYLVQIKADDHYRLSRRLGFPGAGK